MSEEELAHLSEMANDMLMPGGSVDEAFAVQMLQHEIEMVGFALGDENGIESDDGEAKGHPNRARQPKDKNIFLVRRVSAPLSSRVWCPNCRCRRVRRDWTEK